VTLNINWDKVAKNTKAELEILRDWYLDRKLFPIPDGEYNLFYGSCLSVGLEGSYKEPALIYRRWQYNHRFSHAITYNGVILADRIPVSALCEAMRADLAQRNGAAAAAVRAGNGGAR
jgi:hypothetical protein